MIRNYFVIIIIFWSFISCQEDGSSNNINDLKTLIENKFEIDFENHLIIYNGNSISIENNTLIIEELEFEIKNAYPKLITGEMYDVFYGNEQFSLFISNLPILTISTNGNTIVDEPKVSASITILEKNQMPKSYNMGIELRGRLSKNYPKPSYSFELWSDENKSEKLKESLLNMRKDDDWILDGLWNEPLRIRDFTSHNIWFKIGRVNKKRDHTKTGISRKYCELFIDGKYLGVYYLGERIDRKQLDLKKHNKQLQGELFKGYDWANGVTFSGLDNFDNSIGTWSGYKAKYPSEVGQLDC
jgi:spore coat protein H